MVYHLEVISWQLGGGKGREPQPIASPSEQAKKQAQIERARSKARRFTERREARARRRREQ